MPRREVTLGFGVLLIGVLIVVGGLLFGTGPTARAEDPTFRQEQDFRAETPLGLAAPAPGCGLPSPVFCETFNAPSSIADRAGQLPPTWGASRFTGDTNGFGSTYDAWSGTTLQTCAGPVNVVPPNDIIICNGQLREASNDHGNVTALGMYPKQPFDFAGRTGKVTFDVSADSQGPHTAWPELWITDQPVPAPFAHGTTWKAGGRNSLGLRFHFDGNGCQTLGSAIVTRNYAVLDTEEGASLGLVNGPQCVAPGLVGGPLNHFEVRVSTSRVEVWATDPGGATLKNIGAVTNPGLSFTRGLVWLVDGHYNAAKFSKGPSQGMPDQAQHTFAWDNVGFDGPFTYVDKSHDVLDALVPSGEGRVNLGWQVQPSKPLNVNTLPISAADIANTQLGARLLFNFISYSAIPQFEYAINGHAHTAPNPLSDNGWIVRTLAIDIPVSDLVPGPNNVTLTGGSALLVVANVNIVLVGVGSGPGPLPTPTATVPVAPTATPVPFPTATPVPVATPTPGPTPVPAGDKCFERVRVNPAGALTPINEVPC